jgi:uncharacterized protein YkwD
MTRTSWILGALALALSGCGATDGATTVARFAAPAATPAAAPPDDVPVTDGRLGPATAATDGGPAVELSPGGRPDVAAGEAPEERAGVAAAAACPNPELAPEAATLAAVHAATVCLVNAERIDRGLPRLTENARLATAARRYAGDMVAGGYFSHTGRDGSDFVMRLRRVGYIPAGRAWSAGENLAWGTGALGTPAAIVRAWMNSPGHRANVLDARFREVGLGIALGNPTGADGAGATYATEFGSVGAAPAARSLRRRALRARSQQR